MSLHQKILILGASKKKEGQFNITSESTPRQIGNANTLKHEEDAHILYKFGYKPL